MESEILQRLHDSEINGKIEWFFDGEWTATLGDEYVGCLEVIETSDFAEAVNELAMAAVKFYPGSEFAKWWNNLNLNKQEK